ncbi:hypothetical protein [Peribacillus frigoritolerans]|uniref:hypothetical protein n=1 Tax=Peribacillus frigoritolerans TaxID=450367 RepID=UPI0024180164|nr:hypothetical protein [Peribacillus frigoritolerans]MDG4850620.1 hypothetical protein [Peribacillus frigoritolerans]
MTTTVTMTEQEKNDLITNHFTKAFKVMDEMAQEQGNEHLVFTEKNFDDYMNEVLKRMGTKVPKIITPEVKRNWQKSWKRV